MTMWMEEQADLTETDECINLFVQVVVSIQIFPLNLLQGQYLQPTEAVVITVYSNSISRIKGIAMGDLLL